jgi:hypothetical protein
MDQLDGDTGLDRAVISARAELGGEECEQRSEPLPAGEEQVLGDLGEIGVVRGRRVEQPRPGSGSPRRPGCE